MGQIIDESLVLLELGLSSTCTEEEAAIVQQAVIKSEGAVRQHLGYDPVQRSRVEYYPQQDFTPSNSEGVWEADSNEAYLRRSASASSDVLQLIHLPVRSSPAIEVRIDYDGRFGTRSGSFGATTVQTEGTDWWPVYDKHDSSGNEVCSDGILRSMGRWPSVPGCVKVTYTAGYTAAELNGQDTAIDASPIMSACVEESLARAKKVLSLWKKNAQAGHVTGTIVTERMGDYSYSVATESSTIKQISMAGGGVSSGTKEMLCDFVNWGVMGV